MREKILAEVSKARHGLPPNERPTSGSPDHVFLLRIATASALPLQLCNREHFDKRFEMSYGTIADSPPSAGRSRVNFLPRLPSAASGSAQDTDEEANPPGIWSKISQSLKSFYRRNFGLFLVFLAQTCGSVVSFISCVQ